MSSLLRRLYDAEDALEKLGLRARRPAGQVGLVPWSCSMTSPCRSFPAAISMVQRATAPTQPLHPGWLLTAKVVRLKVTPAYLTGRGAWVVRHEPEFPLPIGTPRAPGHPTMNTLKSLAFVAAFVVVVAAMCWIAKKQEPESDPAADSINNSTADCPSCNQDLLPPLGYRVKSIHGPTPSKNIAACDIYPSNGWEVLLLALYRRNQPAGFRLFGPLQWLAR